MTTMRDEHYVLGLCDELLGLYAARQHTFDWLRGDTGRRLPVDAFRKLPRQVDRSKLDSRVGFDLGKNVRGGTRPRLSWGRSVL